MDEVLHNLLRKKFKLQEFRDNQLNIIKHILEKKICLFL